MEGGSMCVLHPPEEGGESGDWTAGVVGMEGDDGGEDVFNIYSLSGMVCI